MGAKIELIGEERVKFNLNRYSERINQKVKDQVAISALAIQAEAKKKAPVDTGRLRNSIQIDYQNNGFTAYIGTNVRYAKFVEYGTSPHFPPPSALIGWAKRHGTGEFGVAIGIARKGTPAQPFLFPAFERERPKFVRKIKRVLRND